MPKCPWPQRFSFDIFHPKNTWYKLYTLLKCRRILAPKYTRCTYGSMRRKRPGAAGLKGGFVFLTIQRLVYFGHVARIRKRPRPRLVICGMPCCGFGTLVGPPAFVREHGTAGLGHWEATDARIGLTNYLVLRFPPAESFRFFVEAVRLAIGPQDDWHWVPQS